MVFSGPHTWKAVYDRVRSQADFDHWNKFILPYTDNKNNSIDFWLFAPQLSHKPKNAEYYHLSHILFHLHL